jgi:hypothetical protein
MIKYKKQFSDMIKENQWLFNDFKTIHDKLYAGEEDLREEFNEKGQKVLRVIRRYEDALCSKSENSGFAVFSENLSEKFWDEIRTLLPHIDEIALL